AMGVNVSAGVSLAEAGRAVLDGHAHDLAVIAQQRRAAAELAALVRVTDSSNSYSAAVREYAHSDACSDWHGGRETREPRLREIISNAAEFMGEQMRAQIVAGLKLPFRVRNPGSAFENTVDD